MGLQLHVASGPWRMNLMTAKPLFGEVPPAVSRSMRGNRKTDSQPEVRLRRALWARGLRGYRKNMRALPGTPDVVYTRKKIIVFVNGCFWHRCPRCSIQPPRTNSLYWSAKLNGNAARDARNEAELKQRGYEVVIVWECEIKRELSSVVERLAQLLAN
jgi:DNA mismatch endonuclease, patch repair protein